MPSEKNIVYRQEVVITRDQLQDCIRQINRDYDDESEKLTIEEVRGNKRLLKYICSIAVEDGMDMIDPLELWNNDGWVDVEDYR